MLTVVPDRLVLMKPDHILHVVLGILFIIGGFAERLVRHKPVHA